MERQIVEEGLLEALAEVVENDRHLFETNAGERTIATRLAMALQKRFPTYVVDAEFNRDGTVAKRLRGLPVECAGYRGEDERSLAVPDVIIHRRGKAGPNLLVLELKKSTNPDKGTCDRSRLRAFLNQFGYKHGALVVCETRKGRDPNMTVAEWLEGAA